MSKSHPENTPSIYLQLLALLGMLKQELSVLAEAYGLTLMQAKTVHLLGSEEEATMSSLSTALHCDASNVTGIAERLEAQGIAERRRSKLDRRVTTLELTPQGEEVRQAMLAAIAEMERKHLSAHLSASQIVELGELLDRLVPQSMSS